MPDVNWLVIYPEMVIVATAALVLIVDLMLSPRNKWVLGAISFVGVIVAMQLVFRNFNTPGDSFYGMIVNDTAGSYFKTIFCLGTLITVFLSATYQKREFPEIGEYYTLILLATFGMMVMASSVDLITIFIGLEMMSIPLYVLAGIYKERNRSAEASLKYFLLGAFASGFLLYGIAFIYGAFKTTNLVIISALVSGGEAFPVFYVVVGMLMILIGLAFKAGVVPFHMWIPDVYEGAPAPATAFMSAGPKAAAIIAIIRIFVVNIPDFGTAQSSMLDFTSIFWVLAVVTMTWGNILALTQSNIKRMLAYSSIAHVGYILIAITVGFDGISAAAFYLFAYTLMNLGAFTIIILFAERGEFYENISDYSGFGSKFPFAAIAMTIFMASLGGIPGTAGFIGKFMVFKSAIQNGYIWLAVIGVLNSVISIFYYLRIVVAMYMKPANDRMVDVAITPTLMIAIVITLVGVLYIGIFPETWLRWAEIAAANILP